MATGEADEPVHGHSCQGAHEELASYGIGAAYQHHLRVERSEMCFGILHPCEDHLGPCECVGDQRLQNLLREWRGKLPWGGETFGLIWVALPLVVAQAATQFFVCSMKLFISRLRGRKIRLHAFLLCPRFCHFILQPLHHGHDLLHGHFLARSARWTLSRGPHSLTFSLNFSCCYGISDKLSRIVVVRLMF